MEKQKARIENWAVIEGGQRSWLCGTVYDHPRSELNGHECYTSTLEKLDRENKIAETRNTVYTLGVEAVNAR